MYVGIYVCMYVCMYVSLPVSFSHPLPSPPPPPSSSFPPPLSVVLPPSLSTHGGAYPHTHWRETVEKGGERRGGGEGKGRGGEGKGNERGRRREAEGEGEVEGSHVLGYCFRTHNGQPHTFVSASLSLTSASPHALQAPLPASLPT